MATQMPRERARLRVRKWGKRLAIWLGSFAALAVIATFVLLHNLDRPWVKRRVQAIVSKEVGVDIDYGAVHLALASGIDIDDLVVRSPPAVREAAPELARIQHVAARWSPRSLVAGGSRIEHLALTDATVTIAVDENGLTSLDVISPGHVPLSHQLASLLGSLPVRDATARNLTVELVDTDHGAVVERTGLRGIALEWHGEPAPNGGAGRLRLGSTSAPLELDLERHGSRILEGMTHARGSALAVASSSDVVLAIDLNVSGRAVHVAGRARFDAPASKTDVAFDAQAAEGTSEGFATIPDGSGAVLHRVDGDLDAAGFLDAERAHLRYHVVEAKLATPPRLEKGGAIEIAGDVAKLRLPLDETRSLRVETGTLAVHMLPDTATSAMLHASLTTDSVTLGSGAQETRGSDADLRIDGRVTSDGAFDGTSDLRFASLHTPAMDVRGGHVGLRLGDLRVDRDHVLATRGDVALTGDIASIASSTALASTLAVKGHADLTGHAPYAASAEVTAARLRLSGLDAPARIAIDVTNALPDLARPIASTGTAHVEASLGEAKASLDAGKESDAVDYELHAHAPSLERARRLVPAKAAALLPLERMAVAMESKGRIERLSSALPEIRHHTKLDVDHPGVGEVSARSLSMTVDSHGSAMRHDAQIDVRARALTIAGSDAADEHATISAKIDRARPSLDLVVKTDGRTTGKIAVASSFNRGHHSIAYDVDATASKLGTLEPLFDGVPGLQDLDLSELAIGLSAKGELFGVVRDVTPDGKLRLEPDPAATVALSGPMDVRVDHFGFVRGDLALKVPNLAVHADFGFANGRRTVESRLDMGGAHLASGPHEVDVAHISDRFSATVVGDLRNPDADVENHVTLAAVHQEFVPTYPVSDVLVDLLARRDHRGVVRIDDLRLTSAAGGTKIAITGDLDVSGARRRLALRGELDQDMARLSAEAGALGGAGRASATIQIESGNLVDFTTRSDVHLAGVDLRLPREGIVIESLDGEVPIQLDFRAKNGRITMLKGRPSSPFALLRFVDQQPLLSRTSFLSAKRVITPYGTFAPVVGNLQIERNILSLRQVEMGFHGGRLGGECTLDYTVDDSTLEVHVRGNGIRSSNGEPFDGNAAFLVTTRDRSLDGRGQILRIGKRQFHDLLDLIDPPHTNASVNRVRSAMKYGYPARVDLAFNHGFANAHVELGGFASLFRVGDIRGVPTGPVFERLLKQWHRSKGRR